MVQRGSAFLCDRCLALVFFFVLLFGLALRFGWTSMRLACRLVWTVAHVRLARVGQKDGVRPIKPLDSYRRQEHVVVVDGDCADANEDADMAHTQASQAPSSRDAIAIDALLAKVNASLARAQAPESCAAIRARLQDLANLLDR